MNKYRVALRKVFPEDTSSVNVEGDEAELSKELVLTILKDKSPIAIFMPPAWMYYTIKSN